MTEGTIIALVASVLAAVPPTLVAWAALRQGQANSKKSDAVDVKTDALIEKTTEIHTLANSNLAKVTASLEVANTKISGLEKQIALLVEQKSAKRVVKK